jgi:iron(III) transport system permease protein
MYFFVNSMATVSAVIFLYSADIPLATVAVANMDDAGDIAAAAAMSMLVVLVNVGVRLLYEAATRGLQRRTQAWTSA